MPTSSSTSNSIPKSTKCSQTLDLQLNLSHFCGSNLDLAKLIIQIVDGALATKHASFAGKVTVPCFDKDSRMCSLMIQFHLTGRFTQSKSQSVSSGNLLKLQQRLEKLLLTSSPAQDRWERLQYKQAVIFFYVRRTQLTTPELSSDLKKSLAIVQLPQFKKLRQASTIPWAVMKRMTEEAENANS